MDTSAPPEVLDTGDIAALAQWLRDRDIPVASQQMIAAAKLLSGPRRAASPASLGPYLAPIFCATGTQQLGFEEHYQQWLRHRSGVSDGGGGQNGGGTEIGIQRRKRYRHGRVTVIIGLLFLIVLAGLLYLGRLHQTVVTVLVDNKPVAVTVQIVDPRIGQRRNALGQVVLAYRQWHLPLDVTVVGDALVPVGTDGSVTKKLEQIQPLFQIALATPKVEPEPAPLQPLQADKLGVLPAPPPAWERGVPAEPLRLINWVSIAAAGALLLIPLAWWLLFHARRRGFLERLPRDEEETKARMQAQLNSALPALAADIRYLSREMRRRRSVASRALDVGATLKATLRSGGLPQLMFGTQVEPDYLMLVDCVGASDHQTRLSDDVIKVLSAQGVCLERYVFNEVLRVVRHAPLAGATLHTAPQHLEQLLSRHPDASLLIFSDGTGLIDAYSGRPRASVASLLAWQNCVLITPQPCPLWSTREWQLANAGLSLVPLNGGGLRALAEILRQERIRRALPREAIKGRRQAYLRDVDLLLDRKPLDEDALKELMRDLRADLGQDGLAWLAACAVYPEVHWGVTLAVGDGLAGGGAMARRLEPYAHRLAQLAHLPWLRVGYMPDWLRNALLAELSEAEDQTVRASLDAFLSGMAPAKGAAADSDGLDFSSRRLWHDAWSGLRSWLARRPKPEVLEDAIFLRFMNGKRPHGTVDAVDALMQLLFRKGEPLAGPRAWPLLAGLLAAAVLAYVQPPLVSAAAPAPWIAHSPAPRLLALDAKGKEIVSADDTGAIVLKTLELADGSGPGASCKLWFKNAHPLALTLDGSTTYAYAVSDEIVEQSIDSGCAAKARKVKSMRIAANGTAAIQLPAVTADKQAPGLCVFGKDRIVHVMQDAADAFVGPDARAEACAVSVDGTKLFIASSAGKLGILPLGDKGVAPTVVPIPEAGGRVMGIAVSGDAEMVALVHANGAVSLFRTMARQWTRLGNLHARAPLALSGDATTLATATDERTVQVWRLKTAPPTAPPGPPFQVADPVAERERVPEPTPLPLSAYVPAGDGKLPEISMTIAQAPDGAAARPTGPGSLVEARPGADVPPSADLSFTILSKQKGMSFSGSSVVRWRNLGSRYSVINDAKIPILGTILDGSSEGNIVSTGLAPDTYVQKRFRRDATTTRFDRFNGVVAFESGARSPLLEGLQDHESFVWQLVSMLRARPDMTVGDFRLTIPVASADDTETWELMFAGNEMLVTGAGELQTVHFQRYSKRGSSTDVWLAPQLHGYPVKIRFQEADGSFVEMSIAGPPKLIDREPQKAAKQAQSALSGPSPSIP